LSNDVPVVEKKKAKLGRPKKADILAKKKGHHETRGRPAGEASRIAEFKARLMGTTGTKVIDTVLRKALDDTDKDQVACIKMCLDRILPLSAFDAAKNSGSTPQISINITSLGQPQIEQAEVVETIEYTDVEYSDGTK
jgi:hypothetical protein